VRADEIETGGFSAARFLLLQFFSPQHSINLHAAPKPRV
jgi:hypothetical protein